MTVNKSKLIIMLDFTVFFLFGLIILFIRNIIDLIKFCKDLYSTEMVLKHDIEKGRNVVRSQINDEIDPNFYNLFLLFIKRVPYNQVITKKLINELGKILCIHQQMREIIYFSGKDLNEIPHPM